MDLKNGKNGFESLEYSWLDHPDTFGYETPSGGEHHIYAAPEGVRLAGARDYRGMTGVDRRAGSSYVVWYGEVPESRDDFTPAPSWLCDPIEEKVGAAFDGELDDWLAAIPEGEPDSKVEAAIGRIPTDDFDHNDLIARQFEMVRLAAEGHPGVAKALGLLREAWLRGIYATTDYAYEFDQGLDSAIRNYGAALDSIQALPAYMDTLTVLPSSFPIDMLMGESKPAKHYFDTLRALVATDLGDQQIATLVWNAPTTKSHAREWGIDYLYKQITEAADKALVPVENPTTIPITELSFAETAGFDLVTEDERNLIHAYPTFVDRYLDWAATKVNVLNAPYHRMNALTIMSLAFGMFAFVPLGARPMGLNLNCISLGDSSSGKSESLALRDDCLKQVFLDDREYNLGSDSSPQALQSALLGRDGKPSLFHADEAAGLFAQLVDVKYMTGQIDRLTQYYEGYVPPMLRMGQKDLNGKDAVTSFNISLMGTPKKVTDLLTRDMFESGFLARFIWFLGDATAQDDSQYDEQQSSEKLAKMDHDPVARAFAAEFALIRRHIGPGRHPVMSTDAALERMSQNRKRMTELVKDHQHYDILKPSVRRLGDVIRKVASLYALSEGSTLVELRHALLAIQSAEEWLTNVVRVSDEISASGWQRLCDDLERYIVSVGGTVTMTKLAHRFRDRELKDFRAQLESLESQGRIKNKGASVALNT